MMNIFRNKIVLVTGGTGSFGQKFTEIVLKKYGPKKLIIFSRDEMKQYEMRKKFNQKNIRYFIGDVRDADRLHRAFYGVDIIIHAAALKIVPAAEYNPFEVVKTNVIGAENVINVAIDNKVKMVMALSTDKAANPVNLYGATKLCAEKMFVAANNYSPYATKFSVVRYGNVLGSRGSVIPFFKECALKKVIPITDVRMTRFWITLEEGVNFVIKCMTEMKGGEVFTPKIPSMKIVDLAKAVCPNVKFKIIGIRAGEKLHETMVTSDEGRYAVEKKDMFVIYPDVSFGFGATKKMSGKALPESFEGYRSDTNDKWLSIPELRELISKHG